VVCRCPCRRVFMLLRLGSFVLSALQLRCGFPPRASVHGGGRQRFFFFKRANIGHQMGYWAYMVSRGGRRGGAGALLSGVNFACLVAPRAGFSPRTPRPLSQAHPPPSSQAVPFLYELRALLDWTCTATTFTW